MKIYACSLGPNFSQLYAVVIALSVNFVYLCIEDNFTRICQITKNFNLCKQLLWLDYAFV